MDYLKKRQIQVELDKISDSEWEEICNRCKSFLKVKLFNKTNFGAHSEKELGVPAIDYYLQEAIAKIFSFEWEWKFEKYNMTQQIIRIAGSLISKKVDKYKKKISEGIVETEYVDNMALDIFDEVYDNEIDNLIDCIDRIVKGDVLLELHWDSIKEGYKSSQIAEIIEKPVKYVYRQTEKIIYHAKTKCISSEE